MGASELLHHLRGAGLVLTLTPAGGLHVAPRTALTDDHRVAIRAERDALVLALQTETTSINTCTNCRHRLRYGTCGEPVAAGLLTAEEGFGIVWPPEGHGAGCPAFTDCEGDGEAKVSPKVSPESTRRGLVGAPS